MFSRLSVAHPAGNTLTVDLDPDGGTTVSLPSGAGKSLLADAMLRAFTGDGGHALTATTKSGTTLDVGPRVRQVSRDGVPNRTTSAADYRRTLPDPVPFAVPELTTLILSSYRWIDLYRGGVAEERELRDGILSALPAGDLRAMVAAAMGEDARKDDTTDPRAARLGVSSANSALAAATRKRDEAHGAVAARRADLDAVPAPVDTAAALATIDAAQAWAAYDRAMAPWMETDLAVKAWRARAPVPPAEEYSEAAHVAARAAVEAERAEVEAKEEAERKAQEEARIEAARREAVEAAKVEAARVEAERKAAEERRAEQARKDADAAALLRAEAAVAEARRQALAQEAAARPAPQPSVPAQQTIIARPTSTTCPTCRGTGRLES